MPYFCKTNIEAIFVIGLVLSSTFGFFVFAYVLNFTAFLHTSGWYLGIFDLYFAKCLQIPGGIAIGR